MATTLPHPLRSGPRSSSRPAIGDTALHRDLERMRQLAAALSWSDPLGQELLTLAEGLLDRLEAPTLQLDEPADALAALAA